MRLASGVRVALFVAACYAFASCTVSFAAEKAVLGAQVIGTTSVSFDVYLPLEHRAQLDALLEAQQDTGSAQYQKWLTPDEFHSKFSPSAAKVAAVIHQLESYGITATQTSSIQIHATGPASAVEQIFATQLHSARFRNGRSVIAAVGGFSLPPVMVADGAVVTGLSDFVRVHAHSQKMASVPENRYSTTGPYWFDDLKEAYRYPSYNAYNGKGVTIGVLMSNDFNPTDMKAYFAHEKLAMPNYKTIKINGGAPFDPNDSFETHLDLQQTGGMAPSANIILYDLPDLQDSSIISGLITIIESNQADVVSMSFGGPELGYTAAYNGGVDLTGILGIYDDVFKQGNAQGITFVASSGDLGALSVPAVACLESGAKPGCGTFHASVEIPASSPHVTGVGGTNLITTMTTGSLDSTYVRESAYSDPLAEDIFYGTPATGAVWGSGGGNSVYFQKPVFQLLASTGSSFRTVPDVSLHMGGCPVGAQSCNPDDSSVVVAIDGAFYAVIGTSAAAPDFAGLVALKIQRNGGRLGNENPEIYGLAALQSLGLPVGVYHSNVPGDNGLYTTKNGYDRVLGNGSVNGVNFMLAPLTPVAGTPQTPTNP
jgi:subtilase family serine protease